MADEKKVKAAEYFANLMGGGPNRQTTLAQGFTMFVACFLLGIKAGEQDDPAGFIDAMLEMYAGGMRERANKDLSAHRDMMNSPLGKIVGARFPDDEAVRVAFNKDLEAFLATIREAMAGFAKPAEGEEKGEEE